MKDIDVRVSVNFCNSQFIYKVIHILNSSYILLLKESTRYILDSIDAIAQHTAISCCSMYSNCFPYKIQQDITVRTRSVAEIHYLSYRAFTVQLYWIQLKPNQRKKVYQGLPKPVTVRKRQTTIACVSLILHWYVLALLRQCHSMVHYCRHINKMRAPKWIIIVYFLRVIIYIL